MSENASCACGRTHCCSCAAQLYDAEIARLRRDWEAMNKAADRFCADWKRAESRLFALAAAAREYRDAGRKYGGGLRPEFAPKVWESGEALDALLSGEEGR